MKKNKPSYFSFGAAVFANSAAAVAVFHSTGLVILFWAYVVLLVASTIFNYMSVSENKALDESTDNVYKSVEEALKFKPTNTSTLSTDSYFGYKQGEQKNGYGIHYINNREFYVGQFKNDKRHGYGCLCENGMLCLGKFKNGESKISLNVQGRDTFETYTDNFKKAPKLNVSNS
ncbi:MAG: hypothetical protein FWG90_08500 [Oscillospiraceae bacterium]|nr:hypothetical protein [Oscillospiraceae bacterium]